MITTARARWFATIVTNTTRVFRDAREDRLQSRVSESKKVETLCAQMFCLLSLLNSLYRDGFLRQEQIRFGLEVRFGHKIQEVV